VSVIAQQTASIWILVVVLVAGACSRQSPPAREGASDRSQPSTSQAGSPGTPSQPSGGYEGYFEEMSCDRLRGWAWDPSQPDRALMINLYDGDRLLKTTVADQFRQDLLDGRKGNGRHQFAEAPPPEIRDGRPHAIRAVVKGTNFTLRPLADTPSSIRCAR
jgi:hypothetical protein